MVDRFGPTAIRFAESNRPARNYEIEVLFPDTSVKAPLFRSESTTDPLANPVRTDDLGNLTFYTEAGYYDLLVNGARIRVEVEADVDDARLVPYEHTQEVVQTTWTIDHNLGRDPIVVQVFNEDGVWISDEFVVMIMVPNEQVVLGFDLAFKGRARLI